MNTYHKIKYCSFCNEIYELQLVDKCSHCGSTSPMFFLADERQIYMIRFFGARKIKEYLKIQNKGKT